MSFLLRLKCVSLVLKSTLKSDYILPPIEQKVAGKFLSGQMKCLVGESGLNQSLNIGLIYLLKKGATVKLKSLNNIKFY